MDDAQLERAAALGLIERLAPQVQLVSEPASTSGSNAVRSTVRARVFDRTLGYLRTGPIQAGAEQAVWQAWETLPGMVPGAERLTGLVLDLRFANGDDYEAAARMADWFFAREQPLADWGAGPRRATAKTNAISLPVVALVNGQTRGGAEVLAGILRAGQVGLILGSTTAGRVSIAKEFTLRTGQRLRVATAPIKVGDGRTLPLDGLKPDISVATRTTEEADHFDDPLQSSPRDARLGSSEKGATHVAPSTSRSGASPHGRSEGPRAPLEGRSTDGDAASRARPDPAIATPAVQDPVLARALDLLKGLSVVRQNRNR
jgi:C-terminal processing protease CtpA/Prc